MDMEARSGYYKRPYVVTDLSGEEQNPGSDAYRNYQLGQRKKRMGLDYKKYTKSSIYGGSLGYIWIYFFHCLQNVWL